MPGAGASRWRVSDALGRVEAGVRRVVVELRPRVHGRRRRPCGCEEEDGAQRERETGSGRHIHQTSKCRQRRLLPDRCYPVHTAASAARVFLHGVRGLRIPTVRRHMTLTKEDKQQIVGQHGKGEADTGSAEVQIALLTRRINDLTEHLRHALEGPPFAPRPAQARRAPPAAAQLSAAQGSRGLPRPHQGARPQAVARKRHGGWKFERARAPRPWS